GDVTSTALADRRLRRRVRVRQWMVAEGEEPPAVRLRESLAVFHRHVDPVELAIEEPAPGRFLAGAVRKRRAEHAGQLFDDDSSLRQDSGSQIRVDVLLLDVHM